MKTIIGLGNPGKEYENTRHNAGRMAVEYFVKHSKEFSAASSASRRTSHNANALGWKFDKKSNALISKDKKVLAVLPETFMNKSGFSAAKLIKPRKENKDLIVVHDDLDLQLGKIKISYGKNSGGHKGVESVMRALKTKNFIRIRIGVISGKSKPADILKFIVGKFKPDEEKEFKKVLKRIAEALAIILEYSPERAMSEFN